MSDLISRESLKQRINLNYNNHQYIDAQSIKDIINTEPSVEDKTVEELNKIKFELVKSGTQIDFLDAMHIISTIQNGIPLEEKIGHWIRQKGVYGLADTCECSVCGRTIYAGNENDLKDYPYCHCGAKMEEE